LTIQVTKKKKIRLIKFYAIQINIGGEKYIDDYAGKDCTKVFHDEDVHDHTENALKTLNRHLIGVI
jgi:hypothetical protein